MGLFRYKADILDKLGINLDNCNYDYIEKLCKRKEVIVFDRTSAIRSLLHYGIQFEEVKNLAMGTVLEKVHKYVKNKKCDLVFAHCQLVTPPDCLKKGEEPRSFSEEVEKGFAELNKRVAEIYKEAEDDTREFG